MCRFILFYVLLYVIQCQPIHEKRSPKHGMKMTLKEINEINNMVQDLKASTSELSEKNKVFRIKHIKLYIDSKTDTQTDDENTVLEVFVNEDPDIKNDIQDQKTVIQDQKTVIQDQKPDIQDKESVNLPNKKEKDKNVDKNLAEVIETNPVVIENDIDDNNYDIPVKKHDTLAKKSDIRTKTNRKMTGKHSNRNDIVEIKEINEEDTVKKLLDILSSALNRYGGIPREKLYDSTDKADYYDDNILDDIVATADDILAKSDVTFAKPYDTAAESYVMAKPNDDITVDNDDELNSSLINKVIITKLDDSQANRHKDILKKKSYRYKYL